MQQHRRFGVFPPTSKKNTRASGKTGCPGTATKQNLLSADHKA